MQAILNFLEFVIQAVLQLSIWLMIAYAILSTLISFNVLNVRNRIVGQIWGALDAVAQPLLSPIRRILPRMGQFDFSVFIFVVLVGGVSGYLIPPLFTWLRALTGGPVGAY